MNSSSDKNLKWNLIQSHSRNENFLRECKFNKVVNLKTRIQKEKFNLRESWVLKMKSNLKSEFNLMTISKQKFIKRVWI